MMSLIRTPLIALAFVTSASADTYNCITGDEIIVVEHKNNLAYPRCNSSHTSTHPNGFLFNCLTESDVEYYSVAFNFKYAVKVSGGDNIANAVITEGTCNKVIDN